MSPPTSHIITPLLVAPPTSHIISILVGGDTNKGRETPTRAREEIFQSVQKRSLPIAGLRSAKRSLTSHHLMIAELLLPG
ncbi:MAG: hypothetical protein WKF68_06215 [Daejeonella sp.]